MLAIALQRSFTRERVRRELGGWLELLTVGGDRYELSPAVRDPLARRALATLKRLCEEDREAPDFQYLEGLILRILEQHEEAIPPLRRSAEQEPEKIGRWLALAWCYKRTGQIELAIDALLEAREFEPGEAILHYNLACYWSLAGHLAKALESLSIAFELDSSYRDLVAGEHDFDAIRSLPAFRELCSIVV
jgi:tetratricopeptide (TPR) repeat protein